MNKNIIVHRIFLLFLCLSSFGCGVPNPRPLVRYSAKGEKIKAVYMFPGDYPASSPDGKKILYVDGGIMLADADAGEGKKLVLSGYHPAWSPVGGKIAFARPDGIWTMNEDGGELQRIIKEPGVAKPAWNGGGGKIAYMRDGIRVYDIASASSVMLFKEGSYPAWSPVCDHIFFQRWEPLSSAFHMVAAKYKEPEVGVLIPGGTQAGWSPDGKYLLFCRTGIWIKFMDAMSDGKEVRLTQWGIHPCWSGDGKWIFFSFKGFIYKINVPYSVNASPLNEEIHPRFRPAFNTSVR